MKRWYVTCSESATDPRPEEAIWTLSRDPNDTGWETDAGYDGYGLTKKDAEELANAANCVGVLRKIMRSASGYAFAEASVDPPGLKRKLRAQIKSANAFMRGAL
jgi:hypothetical protein